MPPKPVNKSFGNRAPLMSAVTSYAMEANKIADEKGLVVVIGYQRHYAPNYQQMVEKIAEGATVISFHSRVYWNGDGIWERGRQAGDTEMQYQMRNWFHFNWLCGGRHCRTALPQYRRRKLDSLQRRFQGTSLPPGQSQCDGWPSGSSFPAIPELRSSLRPLLREFTYADGSQMFSQCRHQANTWSNVSEFVYGTEGREIPTYWLTATVTRSGNSKARETILRGRTSSAG